MAACSCFSEGARRAPVRSARWWKALGSKSSERSGEDLGRRKDTWSDPLQGGRAAVTKSVEAGETGRYRTPVRGRHGKRVSPASDVSVLPIRLSWASGRRVRDVSSAPALSLGWAESELVCLGRNAARERSWTTRGPKHEESCPQGRLTLQTIRTPSGRWFASTSRTPPARRSRGDERPTDGKMLRAIRSRAVHAARWGWSEPAGSDPGSLR